MPKLLDEAAIARYRAEGYATPLRAVEAAQAERWRAVCCDSSG